MKAQFSEKRSQNLILHPDRMYRVAQICRRNLDDTSFILPISPNTWWKGIRDGRYPRGQKLSARVTAWRGRDLLEVMNGTWVAQG